jgi:molybdopterin/thiamine biosynthesis adenylyltransferase
MTTTRELELSGEIDFTRGRGFFDPTDSDARVTIVGCGGIGSPLALALSKMGMPRLTLIDGDTVERHNLPNQLFPIADKGKSKVESLAEVCRLFGASEVETHAEMVEPGRWPTGRRPNGIVVLALDSIEARRMIHERHLRYNIGVSFVVDPRLGGQSVVLNTYDPRKPDQVRRYEETLFDPANAVEAPCTMRSIIDVGFVVASLVTRVIRLHCAGEPVEHTLFWNHKRLRASVGMDEA